jgi:proline iminopeptidase
MKQQIFIFVFFLYAVFSAGACDMIDPGETGVLVPLTVDEDPSIPSIDVNGTRLHSESFGNPGDPLIIVIHGGPGSDYRSLLNSSKLAADGYHVVFYDQRGCGLSRRHDPDVFTIPTSLNDLSGVIDHYRQSHGQPVILLGQSWGAMLATAFVNEYPEKITGMILIEPGALTWADTKAYMSKSTSPEFFSETSNDYLYIDRFLSGDDHVTLDYRAALQRAAEFSAGNRFGNHGPYPFWRAGAVCSSGSLAYAKKYPFDFTTHLYRYTNRILFLYSELNTTYGAAHAAKVSSAYPNVRMSEVRGAGHYMIYFGWNEFYPIVKSYLTDLLSTK